jgi:uncharacterized SAM-binding protein YcdF (DUF218 family)
MFYYASKILWIPAQPSNLLVCAVAAGVLALLLGRRKLALWLLCPATAVLVAITLLPLGQWLLLPLENRFPPPGELPAVDGVIVLGGGIALGVSEERGLVTFRDTDERFITLIELARRYPDARLVFTGGGAFLAEEGITEAKIIRRFVRDHGLDPERMIFEDQARNTYQNAVLSKALVRPAPGERWLLVTSAHHMPRAIGAFRQVGWPVIAYPVDYRTSGDIGLLAFPDAAGSWGELDEAIKSWTGLLAYWLTDRIDSPFPAP